MLIAPRAAARWRAVLPVSSSELGFASHCRRSITMFSCAPLTACCRADHPPKPVALMSALLLHRYLTVSSCPFRAAQSSAVHPDVSDALISNASYVFTWLLNAPVSPNLLALHARRQSIHAPSQSMGRDNFV